MSTIPDTPNRTVTDQPESWWQTFRRIFIAGAEIAIKVLPILISVLKDESTSRPDRPEGYTFATQTGPVEWQVRPRDGDVKVVNIDQLGREVVLTFSPAFGDRTVGGVVPLTQPGTPGAESSVSGYLASVADGQVTIVAVPTSTSQDNLATVLIPFAIAALAGAGAIALTGGLELVAFVNQPTPTKQEYGLSLRGANLPRSAEITAKHPASGTELTLKADRPSANSGTTEETLDFPFPPDLITDGTDSLQDIVVTLDLPYSSLQALGNQRR